MYCPLIYNTRSDGVEVKSPIDSYYASDQYPDMYRQGFFPFFGRPYFYYYYYYNIPPFFGGYPFYSPFFGPFHRAEEKEELEDFSEE